MRSLLALPIALIFAFPYAAGVGLWAALFPKSFKPRMGGLVHFWGRTVLKILGIELVLEGTENLRNNGEIIMTNHVNELSLPVFASIWPANGTVIKKQEFHRVPIIGRTMRAIGFIPIDRSNRASGMASLERAAQRMRDEGATLLIAPEGTRSGHGRLLPFKKGPFHLALATRAPVVVAIMRGNAELLPRRSWLARPGTITVRFLEAVSTQDWRPESLAHHMAEIRAMFLEHIEDSVEAD